MEMYRILPNGTVVFTQRLNRILTGESLLLAETSSPSLLSSLESSPTESSLALLVLASSLLQLLSEMTMI